MGLVQEDRDVAFRDLDYFTVAITHYPSIGSGVKLYTCSCFHDFSPLGVFDYLRFKGHALKW